MWAVKSFTVHRSQNAIIVSFAERAAKLVEQQERERPPLKQASPRAGTPVGALMGVVPSPSTMGMINQTMTPVAGNPSWRQHECLTTRQQGNEAGLFKSVLLQSSNHYKCIYLFICKPHSESYICLLLLVCRFILFRYCVNRMHDLECMIDETFHLTFVLVLPANMRRHH